MSPREPSVRLPTIEDYRHIVDYFLKGSDEFHLSMGVARSKLPKREDWLRLLYENHSASLHKKTFYYVIWMVNGEAIGHSNINKIIYGEEAYTHLHMWRGDIRNTGLGFELMKLSLPHYFNTFDLKNIYCEPYALNDAPNKTLKKLGFEFIQRYETIPGWISFHQPVNRWVLSKEKFELLHKNR